MKNRVVSNAAWIIGCRIVQAVLQLIVGMLTARYLGPSNYGLINYAVSLVAFAAPVMKLGLDSILVREIVQNPEKEGTIVGSSLVMNLCSSFLCIVGISAFVSIANAGETDTLIVCLLYSTILVAQAVEMLQYWFQAKLLSKYTSLAALIAYVAVAIYRIILLISGKSIYWFAVANVLDVFIIDIFLIALYKKHSRYRLNFSLKTAKRLFRRGKYFIISSLMVTVFAQTGAILLKLLMDNTSTGYYTAAVSCAGLTSFIFSAIIDSMRPSILAQSENDNERFQKSMTMLYSIIIYFTLVQNIIVTIFAEVIIKILYGTAYLPTINALRLLIWYTTFSYLGGARNVWILAKQKEQVLWKVNLLSAMLNIILNLLLIPRWGVMGAVFTALITQIFSNVSTCFIFRELRENLKLMRAALNPKCVIGVVNRLLQDKQVA